MSRHILRGGDGYGVRFSYLVYFPEERLPLGTVVWSIQETVGQEKREAGMIPLSYGVINLNVSLFIVAM